MYKWMYRIKKGKSKKVSIRELIEKIDRHIAIMEQVVHDIANNE